MSTERRNPQSEEAEDGLGVLDSTGAIGTVGIGLLGEATAQVPVALPVADDDDLVDDDVTDGEAYADLVLDADPAALVRGDDGIGRIHEGAGLSDIVIEIPAPPAERVAAAESAVLAEPVDEAPDAVPEAAPGQPSGDALPTAVDVPSDEAEDVVTEDVVTEDVVIEQAAPEDAAIEDAPLEEAEVEDSPVDEPEPEAEVVDDEAGTVDAEDVEDRADDLEDRADAPVGETGADASASTRAAEERPWTAAGRIPAFASAPEAAGPGTPALAETTVAPAEPAGTVEHDAPAAPAVIAARLTPPVTPASPVPTAIPAPAANAEGPTADVTRPATAPVAVAAERLARRARAVADPAPLVAAPEGAAPAPAIEEETMAADHAPASDPGLASRRLDQLGDRERESADLLTADRLLDASRIAGPEPEGLWSHLLYTVSGRRINLGDGKRAQQRKALSARIAAPLPGTARFVPVLSRKGGVGKTTVTALLGMALADSREDRVIAVDANPDRGTLADRIARTNSRTVRDLVRIHDQVTGYHDVSAVVSRDATRLDVLASDTDPRVSEAFSDEDYDQVASVAAHYYSLVLTDTGTGIVHSVMGATLDRADTIVVVAGLSVDEARLASETLTWLEANGYADKVREAVVVLNQSSPGTPMVRLNELEAHFRTRVAHVLRLPYDARIAAGSAITFAALQPETRQAARELAAVVVEGLRAQAA